jgi:hypothetical protein
LKDGFEIGKHKDRKSGMRRFQIDRDRHTVTFKVDRQMDRR